MSVAIPHDAACQLVVLDAEKRARICNGPAVTTRTVDGERFFVCALCAPFRDKGKVREQKPLPLPPPKGPRTHRRRR
jgi:hypothetical protein